MREDLNILVKWEGVWGLGQWVLYPSLKEDGLVKCGEQIGQFRTQQEAERFIERLRGADERFTHAAVWF